MKAKIKKYFQNQQPWEFDIRVHCYRAAREKIEAVL